MVVGSAVNALIGNLALENKLIICRSTWQRSLLSQSLHEIAQKKPERLTKIPLTESNLRTHRCLLDDLQPEAAGLDRNARDQQEDRLSKKSQSDT